MPKLSNIKYEAELLLGRLSEPRRQSLQKMLADLCEARWEAIRGPAPASPLAHVLWSVPPSLADLFADLYAAGDSRLDELLEGHRPEWGLALLVISELERNDADGARLAYELMMIFQSTDLDTRYAERIAAALRGHLETGSLPRQLLHQPLWKALAVMVEQTKRWNIQAMVMVIRLLSSNRTAPDDGLEQLTSKLQEVGIRFLGIDDSFVHFELHGTEHKRVSVKQLGDILFTIRQAEFG